MAATTVSSTVVCFVSTNRSILAPCTAAGVVSSTSFITITQSSDSDASAASTSTSNQVVSDTVTAASTSTTVALTEARPSTTSSQSITLGGTTSPTYHSTITSYESKCTDPATAQGLSSASSKPAFGAATLAGATVGAFVAGVLLAAAIGLLCLRRRKHSQNALVHHGYPVPTKTSLDSDKAAPTLLMAGNKSPTATTIPAVATKPFLSFLPEPVTDDAVRRALQLVMDQVQSHVEWYYQDTNVDVDVELSTELSRFETGHLSRSLQACFELATKPTVLIKHCLMFHTFNHTVAPGEGIIPILPNEIASMIGILYNQSLRPDASPDQIQAFALHKSLTTYLLPTLTLPRRQSLTQTPQAQKATRFAYEFTDVFSPWASALANAEQRAEHLSQVIQEAVRTATWLFAQPDLLRFDWSLPSELATQSGQGECVVISPYVRKSVVGGRRLKKETRVLSAVIKRMQ